MLLLAAGGQSAHGEGAEVAGELALVPPLLGASQRLLNRDHAAVYYEVWLRSLPPAKSLATILLLAHCQACCSFLSMSRSKQPILDKHCMRMPAAPLYLSRARQSQKHHVETCRAAVCLR